MSEVEIQAAGVTRRDMMRLLVGGAGALVTGLTGLVGESGVARAAAAPKRGGSIRVAYDSSSTADTLDPAKGSSGPTTSASSCSTAA